jgi:hypothetical protein
LSLMGNNNREHKYLLQQFISSFNNMTQEYKEQLLLKLLDKLDLEHTFLQK